MSYTSGTVEGNRVSIGGYSNNGWIFTNWQLASQSIANNTSTINWQSYAHFVTADCQLDNGWMSGGGATRWSNGGRILNYSGNYTTRDVGLASGSFTVSHDGAGNYNLPISCYIEYTGVSASSGSGSYALPTIPRYAAYLSSSPYAETILWDRFNIAVNVDATCDQLAVSIDGGGWAYYTADWSGWKVVTISGLAAGSYHTFKTSIKRKDSQLWTESSTKGVTTIAKATITGGSTNITDEDNPYITFSNPSGGTMDVWLEVNPSGTHYAERTSITNNGTYTWTLTTAERNQLRAVLTASNTGTLRLGLYNNLGGSHTYNSVRDTGFSIINANPTFTTVAYHDSNTTVPTGGTAGITGNTQYIIQNKSVINVDISSGNKAVALKGATMVSYTATINSTPTNFSYSASTINQALATGSAGAATDQTLYVTATDSRGNTTTVQQTVTMVAYVAPTLAVIWTREDGFGANTTIDATGTISTLTVAGVDKNVVNTTSGVKYRTWVVGGSAPSYSNIASTTTGATVNPTTNPVPTLNQDYEYNLDVQITDIFGITVTYSTIIGVGKAAFRIGDDGLLYNNGKRVFAALDSYMVGTILITSVNTNPQTILGGTWVATTTASATLFGMTLYGWRRSA